MQDFKTTKLNSDEQSIFDNMNIYELEFLKSIIQEKNCNNCDNNCSKNDIEDYIAEQRECPIWCNRRLILSAKKEVKYEDK